MSDLFEVREDSAAAAWGFDAASEAKFWDSVVTSGYCWYWNKYINHDGYGICKLNGKSRMAHRVAYTLLVADIEGELTIDHLCRTRSCVNPDHLEPVTRSENVKRAARWRNLANTHTIVRSEPQRRVIRGLDGKIIQCSKGHDMQPDSTLLTRRKKANGVSLIRARCMQCQHASQELMRRASDGAHKRGPRGAYGPRDTALFAEYWGFSYEEWLNGTDTYALEAA